MPNLVFTAYTIAGSKKERLFAEILEHAKLGHFEKEPEVFAGSNAFLITLSFPVSKDIVTSCCLITSRASRGT